jgi:hypothetical protein
VNLDLFMAKIFALLAAKPNREFLKIFDQNIGLKSHWVEACQPLIDRLGYLPQGVYSQPKKSVAARSLDKRQGNGFGGMNRDSLVLHFPRNDHYRA